MGPSTFALINIDGTRNQIFVFGSASFAWDSNIYSEGTAKGDYTTTAAAGVELKRRAGIIAVNATMSMSVLRFASHTGENSANPSFNLALNKSTGRTTGTITVSAFRESRSDSAVNLRTQSWNFPLGLSLKYPVSERFYLTSESSYLNRRYASGSGGLANYTDYAEGVNIFYIYTSKLDLLGGYRLRVTDTSADAGTLDHAFTLGATGGILPKVNGIINFGYQIRDMNDRSETFSSFTTSSSLTWTATRRFSLTAQFSRDFSTTATASSVDAMGTLLRAAYIFTRRLSVSSGLGYGRNKFLGDNVAARRDKYISCELGVQYAYNEHLSLSTNYNHIRNTSTVDYADFVRDSYTLALSSRF